MPSDLIKQLLEAGVHFGHKTSRWNPKMKKYIFGQRSGIYIIDLEKTEECLNKARDFLLDLTSKGEVVLFVGTKKQAQEVLKQEAIRSGMYYVTERWPGGLLTNMATVKKSINRLKEIENMRKDGTFEKLTKKEIARLEKELAKLNKNFSGIVAMERMPKAIYVVDTKKEETGIKEARRLGIAVIGLIDTNSNPDLVDYPIPGNDDATKSIQLVTTLVTDAIMEGRKKFLSYLSKAGVPLTEEKVSEDIGTAGEDIEEEVSGESEVEKPAKKAHGKSASDEKVKTKRKV